MRIVATARVNLLTVGVMMLMLGAGNARAECVIKIRVSIKVILNPATGAPPVGVFPALIEATVVPTMNLFFQNFMRGYRFELVDPVTEVGGLGDLTGPSQWFDAPLTDCFLLLDAALAEPVAYAWNPNALNVYINNQAGNTGIACHFPTSDDAIFVLGKNASGVAPTYLQEFGHYFDLCHTQGCGCDGCDTQQTGTCHTMPGDDGISDRASVGRGASSRPAPLACGRRRRAGRGQARHVPRATAPDGSGLR